MRSSAPSPARPTGALALLGALLLTACGDDPIVPSVNTAKVATNTTAPVATAIATPPVVKITDSKGRAAKGVMVRWRVAAGSGRVTNDSVRTSESGEASSGGWTLGTAAGVQTLTATADGVPTVTFTADATPGPAARLSLVAGGVQRGVVGAPVPTLPAARVEDQHGNGVGGVAVTFSISTGGGTLLGATSTSNPAGVATLGGWTLGTRTGDHLLLASAPGLSNLIFLVTVDPGPPASLALGSASSQEGFANERAPLPLVARLLDQYGNPATTAQVTFTPGTGSGSVSSSAVAPDANGNASVTWTLGSAANQTVTATTTALPGTSLVYRATLAGSSQFNIDIRFVGDGGTTAQREAFLKAAVRWRRILSQTLHQTRINVPAGDCDTWVPAINETVRDVLVYVRLRSIDGPGRILASAGPCYVNSASALTAMGLMEFDVDDMAGMSTRGTLEETVVHELGHVLGIGTLWDYRRTLLVGAGSDDPYYAGAAGRTQFAAIGGTSYTGTPVPVENTGGPGTRDGHWRFSIFGNELMNPFEGTPPARLSTVTAASLADLGYPGVLLSGADTFRIGTSAFFESPAALIPRGDDIARVPLVEIRPDGSRRLLRAARRN